MATQTARACDAIAADLKQVVLGFEEAAKLYREGKMEEAETTAHAAFKYARMPLRFWNDL